MPNSSLINELPNEEWQKIIGNIVHKLTNKFGRQDEDDLKQEAWITLYYAATKYKTNKNTKFTTYASICIFRHLFKQLTQKYKSDIEIADEFALIDERKDDSLLREKLMRLMNEEPLLKAYFNEGKTYEQIARETNQFPGTAYKNVKLAVQRVKAKLNEDD